MKGFSNSMAVFKPSGSLNAANAHEFQFNMVSRLQAQDSTGLVVDMSQVEALDSAGLISLVSALKLAKQLSKRFCLCSVPPSIQIIFELTQLDRAFELAQDVPAYPMAA